MKKPYSLDYSIQRDTQRVVAVTDILDKLAKDPSPTELQQMGDYILYGKDQNGLNAVQRGEVTNGNTRFASFRTKADKNISLDAILDNPLSDQQQLQPVAAKKDPYLRKKPTISRPRYDRKSGACIDPGDSDIPGMTQLWESIDKLERWIHVLEGKLPPNETDLLFDDSYRLYQLKHMLIDLRHHQYYLKDAYKPTLHLLSIDHPKPQFIDWTSDSFYWISKQEWERRTSNALLHTISHNLNDYETRLAKDNTIEVKWVVRRHTFDWQNPAHVRALINHYDMLYDYVYDKLDTYSRTLIFDFERYRAMAKLTDVRDFLLDKKIAHTPYDQILYQLQVRYGLTYNENHLSTILSKEIPQRIAAAAQRYRLILETPLEQKKKCFHCGQMLPRSTMFFAHNRSHKDGYSSSCKECERSMRIARGGQSKYDKRNKEATLYKVPPIEG